jgi:hypothetical protein
LDGLRPRPDSKAPHLDISFQNGHHAHVAETSGLEQTDRAETYAQAFPAAIRRSAADGLRQLPTAATRLDDFFVVSVDGESLSIPYRIYNPYSSGAMSPSDASLAALVQSCVYTRHHDGYVRQRFLQHLLASREPWVVPFVVQLIGEYVIEIVEDIHRGLDLRPGSETAARYGQFVADNALFFDLTAQRATSYWNCYHRFRYPVDVQSPTAASSRTQGSRLSPRSGRHRRHSSGKGCASVQSHRNLCAGRASEG